MKLYGAIDLHSNNAICGAIDSHDRVKLRKKITLRTSGDFGRFCPIQARYFRHSGGVDFQLVLASGWTHGRRLPGTSCEYLGGETI